MSEKILNDTRIWKSWSFFNSIRVYRNKIIKKITNKINIPTIGIGSSVNCDGQVLVIDDLIGLSQSNFRFVKKYVDITKIIEGAVKTYKAEVLKKFPIKNTRLILS